MTGIPLQKEQDHRGEILTHFKFSVEVLLTLFKMLWPGPILSSGCYIFSYQIFIFQPFELILI